MASSSLPAAILAAKGIIATYQQVVRRKRSLTRRAIGVGIGTILLLASLFVPGFGGYITHSYAWVKTTEPLFNTPSWRHIFAWMRGNLPRNSVVAADWNYGSHLNVLGEVRTIVDEDHFIPYWIHLTSRHVFCAENDTEALGFLKTRPATHLLFAMDDVRNAGNISSIGSSEDYDRLFEVIPCGVRQDSNALFVRMEKNPNAPLTLDSVTYPPGKWSVQDVRIALDNSATETFVNECQAILSVGGQQRTLPLCRVILNGKETVLPRKAKDEPSFPGAVILQSSPDKKNWQAFYVSGNGYQTLLVQLFLLNRKSQYFKQVYPPVPGIESDIKIWEIHYPPNLPYGKEYLLTDFPDRRLKMAWMYGVTE